MDSNRKSEVRSAADAELRARLEGWQPDVLCLQETKCPQGQFPSGPIRDAGYEHIAEFGQKGYHGVAIVSKRPFLAQSTKPFCGKDDCRHISVTVAGKKPVTIHNLYVPAGGDEPDPKINEKFAHKLQFIDELEAWFGKGCVPKGHEGILVGDLNIAPLEHDVWSHKDLLKVVSHTPIETEGLLRIHARVLHKQRERAEERHPRADSQHRGRDAVLRGNGALRLRAHQSAPP